MVGAGRSGAASSTLEVYAAASLARPLDAVAHAYADLRPGTTLAVSADSSAALATKIEQGARPDLFLAADTANPARLAADGLVDRPVDFATNSLAIVVPEGNPGHVASPADLARPGLKVIAAGPQVPITRYASRLVENLSSQDGYPGDFAARYERNVVSREDSVAGILAKVTVGEGDAGIVYATDARASADVETIPIPGRANVEARYAGAVVRGTPAGPSAAAFLAWLAGARGQAALGPLGFGPPAATSTAP